MMSKKRILNWIEFKESQLDKFIVNNAIGIKIEGDKRVIPILATNRKALINLVHQSILSMRNSWHIAKKRYLINIICPNCKTKHDFKYYKNIPNKSLKCKCGAWLIKYEKEK